MAQVDFGLFDWVDQNELPLQQLYEERLQLLEVADSAGAADIQGGALPV